jgi:hypothetical protein
LAEAVLGGDLAASRVQKDYDLVTESGESVQVRYLANPADVPWVNGHVIDFRGSCDRYALLIVENLDPKAMIVISREGLAGVCALLGKRHPNQDVTLQLTEANFRAIVASPGQFERHGVVVMDLTKFSVL